jgi:hypothetical protein
VFGKTLSGRKLSPEAIKAEPSSYEHTILGAMQHMQLYQGTVASNIKTVRRARRKVATASRKGNR